MLNLASFEKAFIYDISISLLPQILNVATLNDLPSVNIKFDILPNTSENTIYGLQTLVNKWGITGWS